jgi:hypothetical protein
MTTTTTSYSNSQITRSLSKLCLELNKPNADKVGLKKIARDLWDLLIDLYTDGIVLQQQRNSANTRSPPGNKQQQQQQQHNDSNTSTSSNTAAASSTTSPPNHKQSGGVGGGGNSPAQTAARELHLLQLNRQCVTSFLLLIKHRQVRTVLLSMLAAVYNATDSQASHEIKTDLRYLWPTSVNTMGGHHNQHHNHNQHHHHHGQSFNLLSFQDLMDKFVRATLDHQQPYQASWLRVGADIQLAHSLHSEAIKFALKHVLVETRHFFRTTTDLNIMDDKLLKSLIKSMAALGKQTQAALACQLLQNTSSGNNDYSAAYRYVQESGGAVALTADDMDLLYDCVWDMALLEYVASVACVRGWVERRTRLVATIAAQNMNASNPSEIYQNTVRCKRSRLLLRLVAYYFL